MPSLSEVSANAKKIKEQIAEQAGVQTKDVNDSSLKEVSKALDGARVIAQSGTDPRSVPVAELKSAGGAADDDSSPEDLTKQQKIAYAVAAIAPTLLGYAFGGNEGGAIGAKSGQDYIMGQEKARYEKADKAREFNEKKELKRIELGQKSEESQKDRESKVELAKLNAEANAPAKQMAAEMARARMDEMQKNRAEKEEKLAHAKTIEGRKEKLGAEGKQRLDNARMGLIAVQGMAGGLNKGDNTFSVWGDNDFTQQRALFEEALGRMQSGGAISKEEESRFKNMAPTFRDSPQMKATKLAFLQKEMTERIRTLGFSPDELGVQYADVGLKPAGGESAIQNTANAAPPAKALDDMTEDELKEYIASKKGK